MANIDMDAINDMDMAKMSISDRVSMEYKIYVNNLPSELNKNAIEDIFGQYGNITAMFHPYNATWAFITYGSYCEAEHAIRELNNKKPLYLKVALSKDKYCERKEVYKSQMTVLEDVNMIDAAKSLTIVDSNHSVLKPNQALNAIQKYHISKQLEDNSLLQGYNMYEDEESYINTNRLWSRGLVSTADRKRYVSFGRGYTGYEIPKRDPHIEEYIKKVYDQRYNGLYEHLDDKLGKIKRCFICFIKTIKHCEKCDTYYCSKVCQVKDWPRHQLKCERIPALVEETINDISSLDVKDEREKYKSQTKEISTNDMMLQQSQTLMQAEDTNTSISKNNTNITNESINDTINQHRYPFLQYENNAKDLQIKKTEQPAINMNNKDIYQLNQSQVLDQTNTNTDLLEKNAEYSSISSDSYYIKGRNRNIDKNRHYQRNESQDKDRKFAHYNDKKDANRQGNAFCTFNNSDNMIFQNDTYLSKTRFINVDIIMPLDNGEYWIYKTEDTDARRNLMMKLQNIAEKSRNVQPIVGNIYGVQYKNIWYRARVISLNPVKVHFIDFGNDDTLKKDSNIKDIQDISKSPRFARKIRLRQPVNNKYKNLQYGDKISVKMISTSPDKIITVEMQEQLEDSSVCIKENASSLNTMEKFLPGKEMSNIAKRDSTIQPCNIFDALDNVMAERALSELEFVGFLQICGFMQNNIYNATLCPHIFSEKLEIILNNLQAECTKIWTEMENKSVEYKSQVGDIVCGKTKDGWHRGYVLANSIISTNLHIMSIDEAKILTIDKILPCPAKFLDICAFGITCEVIQPNRQLEVGETYKFTTIMKKHDQKQENVKIDIKKDPKDSKISEVITAVIRPWKSSTKFQIPALSKLKNDSKVCLTNYRNHYFMFGRSLDKENMEYHHRIMQCVAQAARTAPYLSESQNIEKSRMVIAPFLDGNHYRAMVMNVQNDKAKIIYVDFGNINEVNVKELQALPDNLKIERSCTAKIYLKNVPQDVPMSKDVDAYLRYLVAEEISLTCTYDGTSFKDGIYLTMPSGESVNEKINRFLQPNWKQENYDDKTCYMLTDMKVASLGNVGDTVDALILFTQKTKKEYLMLAPMDIDLVTHITEVMPSQIKEYCESTEYYIPRAEELCLALYEGIWYRAVCLISEVIKGVAEIFFIDYGNAESIEHKNIRLIPEDFIEPAAMANMCTIVNLAPMNSDRKYSSAVQQVLAELKPMESIVKIKIIDCQESGDYKVELPDVRAMLIEQGLVSS